ncbi:hypothetical protein WGT02_25380 (plasmid) [Rhizobium sp. T1470]|uniref:hypothetical protein n=1 Tax=Rhizobium sp. T1473 TaxID=555321 RepID=UPI0009E6822F|nr:MULTISPECIES: hypothetical protein [Rhizobium]MCA0805704.1 hypothetical protein [Rhizobium sp. T1473]MCS0463512.1 hypothetical protein [Rhizobium favelukesii]UFS78969.1 hypothetical protein LPB79_04880 [Rhizobium sp. T136]
MQRVEPNCAGTGSLTRVWSVKDFSKRHRLDEGEEARLLQLFGAFASASELLYNATREPRWR